MSWFTKIAKEIQVVEVAADDRLEEMTPELAQQVQSLQYHPGFMYLAKKLRLQRSLLRSELEGKRQARLEDSEFIKSGIAWAGWLDDQVRQAVGFSRRQSAPESPRNQDLAAFQAIQRELEIVGAQSSQ